MMTGKKRRARFPALGSIATRKLVDTKAPERGAEENEVAFERRVATWEALRDVEIDVVLCDRDSVLGLENEFSLVWLTEEARQAKDPDGLMPHETVRAIRELHAKAVCMMVKGVRGIDVGEVSLDDVADRAVIAELLSVAGLLADVSRIARTSQAPTPTQLEP